MKKAVIEIDSRQLLHALEQLPSDRRFKEDKMIFENYKRRASL